MFLVYVIIRLDREKKLRKYTTQYVLRGNVSIETKWSVETDFVYGIFSHIISFILLTVDNENRKMILSKPSLLYRVI